MSMHMSTTARCWRSKIVLQEFIKQLGPWKMNDGDYLSLNGNVSLKWQPFTTPEDGKRVANIIFTDFANSEVIRVFVFHHIFSAIEDIVKSFNFGPMENLKPKPIEQIWEEIADGIYSDD
uniref:Uncharacterized protein n=1 Tax=Ochrobactrum phage ORM_20 TaxID=2985243 RepID=A0A9N6ZGF9_9VIRU|nr:hypothetical protein ORM20_00083 [Ochrobactrum phage ORM_20]